MYKESTSWKILPGKKTLFEKTKKRRVGGEGWFKLNKTIQGKFEFLTIENNRTIAAKGFPLRRTNYYKLSYTEQTNQTNQRTKNIHKAEVKWSVIQQL